MKRTLAIACLLAGRVVAQDVTLVYPEDSALIARVRTMLASNTQGIRIESDKIHIAPRVSGNYILRDGDTITASGDVELRMPTFVLSADRAVVNTETREIKASGNVRIILVSPTQK
jgi:lipopolysaccharide assembly outer membrane protein LptD (OstA)